MSDKKKISIMIPCYNEVENARPIYEAVRDEMEKELPQYDFEILFIDNCSTDGTREILRGLLYMEPVRQEAVCVPSQHERPSECPEPQRRSNDRRTCPDGLPSVLLSATRLTPGRTP